jgi:hypothetical protein
MFLSRKVLLPFVLAGLGVAPLAFGCSGSKSHGGGSTSSKIQLDPTDQTVLPSGTVATLYTQSFIASGGTAPYTFSAVSLPPGLDLTPNPPESAAIVGMPSQAGTTSVTIQVVDATNQNVTNATYTLTIK